MKAIFYLVTALLLAACGGGAGIAEQQPEKQCVVVEVVSIQLFGDSTQYGIDGSTGVRANTTPGTALQAAMDAKFGVGAVVVEDRGVSGTNSGQLLDGTDGVNQQWPHSVTAHIAVVNHGINDARDGVTLETYRKHLRDLDHAPGAIVLLETPSPLYGWSFQSDIYATAMRDVAAVDGKKIIDTESFVLSLSDWQALIPDGAHPSSDLYQMIGAKVLAPALMPLVTALKCQ